MCRHGLYWIGWEAQAAGSIRSELDARERLPLPACGRTRDYATRGETEN